MTMKKTLILLAALAVSMSASALDIQDFVLGGARPRGIGAVTPAIDGKYYYQLADRGKTIVLITHAPEVCEWGDRTVHIRDGKLLTDEEERALHSAERGRT